MNRWSFARSIPPLRMVRVFSSSKQKPDRLLQEFTAQSQPSSFLEKFINPTKAYWTLAALYALLVFISVIVMMNREYFVAAWLQPSEQKNEKPSSDSGGGTGAEAEEFCSVTPPIDPEQKRKIESILAVFPVCIFIKGTSLKPRCKHTKKLLELLQKRQIAFLEIDILQDRQLRRSLQQFSSWSTFPQVYAQSKFVGGVDVLAQLDEQNEVEFWSNIKRLITPESLTSLQRWNATNVLRPTSSVAQVGKADFTDLRLADDVLTCEHDE